MNSCPRCGASLPASAYLEPMDAPDDRHPAYRLRHKKANGRMCVAYVGPEMLLTVPPQSVAPDSPLPNIGERRNLA